MTMPTTDPIIKTLHHGAFSVVDLAAQAYPALWQADRLRLVNLALLDMRRKGIVEGPDGDGSYRLSEARLLADRAGHARPLEALLPVAEQLQADLDPLAVRLEIAGSIRRRKCEVRDIELCAMVSSAPALLPNLPLEPDFRLMEALVARAEVTVKRGSKYAQVILLDEAIGPVKVDLFQTTDPAQWGLLHFVRTGSADFVQRALGYWQKISGGGRCKDLRFHRPDGTLVDTPDERAVFNALNCPFVPPQRRIPRK